MLLKHCCDRRSFSWTARLLLSTLFIHVSWKGVAAYIHWHLWAGRGHEASKGCLGPVAHWLPITAGLSSGGSSQAAGSILMGHCYAFDVSFLNTRADQPNSCCFVPNSHYQAAMGWGTKEWGNRERERERGNKWGQVGKGWMERERRNKENTAITSVTCINLPSALSSHLWGIKGFRCFIISPPWH